MPFDEISQEAKETIESMVSEGLCDLDCRTEIKRMTHEAFPCKRDLIEHFERRWYRARLYKYYEKCLKELGNKPIIVH